MKIITRLIGIFCLLVSCFAWSQLAPDVSFDSFDQNKKIKLSALKGKLVYVDFWASWCGPCRNSMPLYEEIYNDYKHKGFVLLAVNLDQVEKDALRFMDTLNVSYPIVKGSDDIAKAFGVKAMPSSFLIDRNGYIVHRHLGFRKGDELKVRQWIEELL